MTTISGIIIKQECVAGYCETFYGSISGALMNLAIHRRVDTLQHYNTHNSTFLLSCFCRIFNKTAQLNGVDDRHSPASNCASPRTADRARCDDEDRLNAALSSYAECRAKTPQSPASKPDDIVVYNMISKIVCISGLCTFVV